MATLADFLRAHGRVKIYEGGWSNHKSDPGGLTKWGVTLATIRALGCDFDGDGDVDAADLRAMTPEEAAEIYLREYWTKARCPDLPAPLAFVVYDSAVNQGPGRAARFLQQAAGASVDGRIGPKTLAAVKGRWEADPLGLLTEYQARRMVHYGGLPIFETFGLGWSRRLIDGTVRATAWHLGAAA